MLGSEGHRSNQGSLLHSLNSYSQSLHFLHEAIELLVGDNKCQWRRWSLDKSSPMTSYSVGSSWWPSKQREVFETPLLSLIVEMLSHKWAKGPSSSANLSPAMDLILI